MYNVFLIFIGVVGLILGIWLTALTYQKNIRIDTESIATVERIENLGFSAGNLVYAIYYKVHTEEPFELLITPCKRKFKIGKDRGIFFEKSEPSKNYYFKTIGQFDSRFLGPAFIVFSGMAILISSILNIIM